ASDVLIGDALISSIEGGGEESQTGEEDDLRGGLGEPNPQLGEVGRYGLGGAQSCVVEWRLRKECAQHGQDAQGTDPDKHNTNSYRSAIGRDRRKRCERKGREPQRGGHRRQQAGRRQLFHRSDDGVMALETLLSS